MRPDQARRSRRAKKASESMSCASSMARSMGSQCGMPSFEAAAVIGACLPAKRSMSTRAGARACPVEVEAVRVGRYG